MPLVVIAMPNRNHGGHGRFCSRVDARSVSPLSADSLPAFQDDLHAIALNTLCRHSDIIEDGGKCLLLMRRDGSVEVFVLSAEGYAAYAGEVAVGESLPGRRGKVGGIQDGHNIRRGIRRWIARNRDVVGDGKVCLCVMRDGETLRLTAVREAE